MANVKQPTKPQPGDLHKDGVVVGIKEAPITIIRPPPLELDQSVKHPGLPRANTVVSKEHPNGLPPPHKPAVNRTVLQQHMDFWDFDKDGIIWPWDTYRGFRKLGYSLFWSVLSMPIIHGTFAWWTQDSWLPNPLMPIYTKNAHKTKHGSDSESFDNEGRFVPEKFEEIFSKFDKDNKGALSLDELWEFTNASRNVLDPAGWVAMKLEYGFTYMLIADEKGLVHKDHLLGVMDGSIFYRIAEERENRKKAQRAQRAQRAAARTSPQKRAPAKAA